MIREITEVMDRETEPLASPNPYSAAVEIDATVTQKSSIYWMFLTAAAAILLGMVCAGSVGWVTGTMQAGARRRHWQYHVERNLVEPILKGDPAYRDIEISEKI